MVERVRTGQGVRVSKRHHVEVPQLALPLPGIGEVSARSRRPRWASDRGRYWLPVLNTPPPPDTREECANIPRPCNRYTCKHHNWTITEKEGRLHDGMHQERIVELNQDRPSCSLDVAEEEHHEACGARRGFQCTCNAEKMSYERIGEALDVTPERAWQIARRAFAKIRVVDVVMKQLDEMRLELPRGATLEHMYPRSNDPNHVYVMLVIRVDEAAKQRGEK